MDFNMIHKPRYIITSLCLGWEFLEDQIPTSVPFFYLLIVLVRTSISVTNMFIMTVPILRILISPYVNYFFNLLTWSLKKKDSVLEWVTGSDVTSLR